MLQIKNMMKHFNAIVKNSKNREILKCINFDGDNSLITCTDSFRLLQLKKEHNFIGNLNPITMEFDDSDYPSIKNLIPTPSFVKLDISEIDTGFLKVLKTSKKEMITLEIDDDQKVRVLNHNGYVIIEMKTTERLEKMNIYLNASYLYDAFSFLKDTDLPYVYVTVHSSLSPILFSNDYFNYLVTPIRKYTP